MSHREHLDALITGIVVDVNRNLIGGGAMLSRAQEIALHHAIRDRIHVLEVYHEISRHAQMMNPEKAQSYQTHSEESAFVEMATQSLRSLAFRKTHKTVYADVTTMTLLAFKPPQKETPCPKK